MTGFASRLLRWYAAHGRHDLPWQQPRSAYRVWLSEIMLQQTQVATVRGYFARFVARFPDLAALAAADIDEVLALWSGLGYYARARNLHRCARLIVAEHGGEFPQRLDALCALPGIGRSTAGAILAQAYGQRQAILDGNVKRVLARHAGIDGWPGEPAVTRRLWAQAEARLPRQRLADYTQALMDLGATVCTARAPACAQCPVRADCVARIEDRVAQLPTPRPRRARPQRHAWLLLIEDTAGFLLERRPPVGIWGGLWCPPLIEAETWQEAAARRYGRVRTAVELPQIRHGFTHFELRITPLRLRLPQAPAADAETEWLTIAAALDRGLPAPVRRLFESLLPCPEPSTA